MDEDWEKLPLDQKLAHKVSFFHFTFSNCFKQLYECMNCYLMQYCVCVCVWCRIGKSGRQGMKSYMQSSNLAIMMHRTAARNVWSGRKRLLEMLIWSHKRLASLPYWPSVNYKTHKWSPGIHCIDFDGCNMRY